MISLLSGTVAHLGPDHAVLDCHGVGYQVFAPARTIAGLAVGQGAKLFTVLNVREDALQLYGFAETFERELFLKLTGVGGVGPRLGLSLLTTFAPAELLGAVAANQPKTLARAPGVGNKLAEKIILDLREYAKIAAFPAATPQSPLFSDVVSALINLGYAPRQAETAAREALDSNPAAPFDHVFRQALKKVA
jgi:Holliday junction DNA helicase RuvA